MAFCSVSASCSYSVRSSRPRGVARWRIHRVRTSASFSLAASSSRSTRTYTEGRSGFFSACTVSRPMSELMRASSTARACSTSGSRFCSSLADSIDSAGSSPSTRASSSVLESNARLEMLPSLYPVRNAAFRRCEKLGPQALRCLRSANQDRAARSRAATSRISFSSFCRDETATSMQRPSMGAAWRMASSKHCSSKGEGTVMG